METFFSSAIVDAIFELMGSPGGRGENPGGSLQDPFWMGYVGDLIRSALWHSAADLKASPLPPAPFFLKQACSNENFERRHCFPKVSVVGPTLVCMMEDQQYLNIAFWSRTFALRIWIFLSAAQKLPGAARSSQELSGMTLT